MGLDIGCLDSESDGFPWSSASIMHNFCLFPMCACCSANYFFSVLERSVLCYQKSQNLGDTEMYQYIVGAFSVVLGVFLTELAFFCRRRFLKPKLQLSFSNTSDCEAETPVTMGNGIKVRGVYIRAKVTNTSYFGAIGCRGYLINIEKQDEQGEFKRTIYCDSMQLGWSCLVDNAYTGITLPKGINQYLDILCLRENGKAFGLIVNSLPFRYEQLVNETGVFRLTIKVAAENADPETIKLLFEWNGDWKNYHLEPEL